jgi:hypothetical protein
MLFKFKSKACADLIMLDADARRLLKIMLGNDPVKGIVLSHDLPKVIAILEQAVALDEAERKNRQEQAQNRASSEDEASRPQNAVSLSQRAAPMLKLLRRSLAEESDVVWGV